MRRAQEGEHGSPYIGTYEAASCFAIVGGNWNNTLLDGAFYVNLNNTVSNTNTNNGAVQSYPLSEQ